MTDKLSVRSPNAMDLREAAQDMLTLRELPPAIVSMGALLVLTGSILTAALTVVVVTYVAALWRRLVVREADERKPGG
jgi:hypothetical protein